MERPRELKQMEKAPAPKPPLRTRMRSYFRRLKEPHSPKEVKDSLQFITQLYGVKMPNAPPFVKTDWLPWLRVDGLTSSLFAYPFRALGHVIAMKEATYLRYENTVHINAWALMKRSRHSRIGAGSQSCLIHECVHMMLRKSTPLIPESPISPRQGNVLRAVDEGLASFAECNYLDQNARGAEPVQKSWLARLMEKANRTISRLYYRTKCLIAEPAETIWATLIKLSCNSLKKEQRAEAIDRYPRIFRHLLDSYCDGHKFVESVAKVLTPQRAFELVTKNPPESVKEILFPERYLQRMQHEIPKDTPIGGKPDEHTQP